MTHCSLVSSVAARIGRAEFLEPLILTEPESLWPPCTRILSISCENESVAPYVIRVCADVVIILSLQFGRDDFRLVKPDFQRQQAAQRPAGLIDEPEDQLRPKRSAVERAGGVMPYLAR